MTSRQLIAWVVNLVEVNEYSGFGNDGMGRDQIWNQRFDHNSFLGK
jgi:hypothetical protein